MLKFTGLDRSPQSTQESLGQKAGTIPRFLIFLQKTILKESPAGLVVTLWTPGKFQHPAAQAGWRIIASHEP